ncbi:hypothetical protein D1AOALGA4SA_7860 [Olavius algarvensis Delta 1 endosymbiont]|nr:hypothetical protein D1AOALGA4SA_7860 [Olavius algarvensis Delta 1 endosymbiont]
MKKQIMKFVSELKSNKKLATFDEASTKQAVVLRLLSFLEWDIFNVEEVYPDYSVNTSNVSYALRVRNANKVFIEVKRVHKKLDRYQKDLISAASRDGVNLAILTNGITWWFYLVSAPGNWKQKWFHSVDLFKQNPEIFVPNLINLLSKTKFVKGQSMRAAKSLFQKKRQKIAADFLPEAWNHILTQPNKIFVELLSDQTEKLCRYKLDAKTVESFIKKHQDRWMLTNKVSAVAAPPAAAMETDTLNLHDKFPNKTITLSEPIAGNKTSTLSDTDTSLIHTDSVDLAEIYKDKNIEAFSFNGNTYKVQSWVEMLTTLCDYFASVNKKDFEKVLWISNDQKARFSRYGDQLRMPEKVKRTDIYVETKLNPGEVVRTSHQLLAEFGFSKNQLDLEVS